MNLLEAVDLREMSRHAVQDFDRRVAAIPQGLLAPFHQEARTLETELLTLYRLVVLCTKREEDLGRVAQWWAIMAEVCDEFALRLKGLADDHPDSGSGPYYDRLLDLRNKCVRMRKMHE